MPETLIAQVPHGEVVELWGHRIRASINNTRHGDGPVVRVVEITEIPSDSSSASIEVSVPVPESISATVVS